MTMPMTEADLERWFSYHEPTEDQIDKYSAIRQTARSLAFVILDMCPDNADRTTAIRKLREAVMTANAAIACEEP
jgi:hypothetical protein